MLLPLTVTLLVTTSLLAVLAGIATLRGRPIDNPMFYLAILIEVLLVVQLVVGIVTMGSADGDMSRGVFVAYLIGLIFVIPTAGFWAIAERESRWGTAVLLVAAIGLAVMIGRLVQLWQGHA